MSARDNGFNDAISSPISKNRDIRVTAFGITTLKIFRMKKRCRFPNHRLILQLNQHFFDEINKLRSSKRMVRPDRFTTTPQKRIHSKKTKRYLLRHILAPQLERHRCSLRLLPQILHAAGGSWRFGCWGLPGASWSGWRRIRTCGPVKVSRLASGCIRLLRQPSRI